MKKTMYFNYTTGVPLSEKAAVIKNAGFDGAELFRFYDNSEPLAEQYGALAEKGLSVEAVHADFVCTNDIWSEDESGDKWLDFLITCAKEQGALGVPTMVVHLSSKQTPPPINGRGISRLRRLCAEAKEAGVSIAFENLRRTEYLDYVLGVIPDAGFCFDCGHELLYNHGTGVLEKHGERLLCVHLHDNNGDRDSHLPPFDGSIDWGVLAKRLSATSLRFALTAEVFCSEKDYLRLPAEVYARLQRFEALLP